MPVDDAKSLQLLLTDQERRKVMTKFGLIGVILLSALSATPVLAQDGDLGRSGYARQASPSQHVRNFRNAYGLGRNGNLNSGKMFDDFERRNAFD